MLVKSTPGVNFIKILHTPFITGVFFKTFLWLQFGFVIFCRKNIGAKAACKMFVKLTPGREGKGLARDCFTMQ